MGLAKAQCTLVLKPGAVEMVKVSQHAAQGVEHAVKVPAQLISPYKEIVAHQLLITGNEGGQLLAEQFHYLDFAANGLGLE
jgi:hypothetical protein